MGERNQRLTRGLSAVYQRDRERFSFLAADQCTDAFLSLYTLFMQGMSGKIGHFQREGRPNHLYKKNVCWQYLQISGSQTCFA